MFEAREGRVRRGRRSASIAGQSNEQDVRLATVSGAMVFGDFLPKQKVTRALGRRGKDTDVGRQTQQDFDLSPNDR